MGDVMRNWKIWVVCILVTAIVLVLLRGQTEVQESLEVLLTPAGSNGERVEILRTLQLQKSSFCEKPQKSTEDKVVCRRYHDEYRDAVERFYTRKKYLYLLYLGGIISRGELVERVKQELQFLDSDKLQLGVFG